MISLCLHHSWLVFLTFCFTIPSSLETQLSIGIGKKAECGLVDWKSGDLKSGLFFSHSTLKFFVSLLHKTGEPNFFIRLIMKGELL